MKRLTPLLVVALTLLLAACQDPPPTFTYEGASTVSGVEQPLTLTYEKRGDRLIGEYQLRAVKGAFRGTLAGNQVTAELNPSPACAYAFEGTLAGTALAGSFEPSDCPGGQRGTWALELQ